METNALLSGLRGLRVQTERASDASLRILNAGVQGFDESRASSTAETRARNTAPATSSPPLDSRSPVSALPLPAETNLASAVIDLNSASRAYSASASVLATADEMYQTVNEII